MSAGTMELGTKTLLSSRSGRRGRRRDQLHAIVHVRALDRIVFTLTLSLNLPHGNPPLPGPLLPLREEREKEFFAFVPRVARSEPDWPTSQPWANGRNPFGVREHKA